MNNSKCKHGLPLSKYCEYCDGGAEPLTLGNNSKYSNDDLMTIVTRLVASLASSGDNFMKPENISKELKQDYVNSHMNLLVEAYNAGIDAAIAALPEKNTLDKHRNPIRQIGVPFLAIKDEGFNDAIDQAKSNILNLKKGEV